MEGPGEWEARTKTCVCVLGVGGDAGLTSFLSATQR